MKFIDVLIENSKLKQARLYNAAKRAFENPSIGITINNPAASHVIKDCADITLKFLPLYIFLNYQSPFQELQGKFQKQDINELIQSSKTELTNNLLLDYILRKLEKEQPNLFKTTQTIVSSPSSLEDDPYSDYYAEKEPAIETKQRSVEEILYEGFKCQS